MGLESFKEVNKEAQLELKTGSPREWECWGKDLQTMRTGGAEQQEQVT